MLPVGHVPIIARLVSGLARGGVHEVTLALGFKPELFAEAFPDGSHDGVRLRYAVGTGAAGHRRAIRSRPTQPGSTTRSWWPTVKRATDLDVAGLVAFHRDRDAEATIHLIAVDDPSAYGVVALDDDQRVERFVEKPAPGTAPSNLINAGTYVLEPSVLARIPAGERVSIERATFPAVAADGGLFAMATDDYWLDTGRPEFYLQAAWSCSPAAGVTTGAPRSMPLPRWPVTPSSTPRSSVSGPRWAGGRRCAAACCSPGRPWGTAPR